MLFAVNKKLRIRFYLYDGSKVEAEIRAITQPLTGLALASNQPIPRDMELDFKIFTGNVTLIRGKGTIIRSIMIRGAHHLGMNVKIVEPNSLRSVTERLAPFVVPEVRGKYVDTQQEILEDTEEKSENWLTSWIESSYRLNLLLDLIAKINSTMDIQYLLYTIMEASKVIMDAEVSSLMLLDEESDELVIRVSTGRTENEVVGVRIPKERGFAGWVVKNKEPLMVKDAQKDERFFGDVTDDFQTKSLVCVPLKNSQNEIMGVLEAVNKKDGMGFQESDIPLFTALADQAAISLEKARLYQESMEKKLLEQQLEMARQIQEGFWPREIPSYEGFEIVGMSVPATHVGGDYYDFIPIDKNRCGIVIADISGKGVPASLLMATLRASLRTQVEAKRPIEENISLLNKLIVKDTPSDKFITLFYGELDAEKREFTYINAGHNPPYLHDKNTGELKILTEGGLIVGVMENSKYTAKTIKLQPNQVIVMFTDGVTEALNKEDEYFDEKRLEKIILENPDLDGISLMHKIYRRVVEHSQGVPQYDDITTVIINAIK